VEEQIARFMLRAAKFEFFLVNFDTALAHTKAIESLEVISGVNWTLVAKKIEAKSPFAAFDFEHAEFLMLRATSPQYLVKSQQYSLAWDSNDEAIVSWDRLLNRSYAQLRNNIAHGNKIQLAAPFTLDRTQQFLHAGHALIDFIAGDIFEVPHWETPLRFN
jgi:hypothetical protein